MFRSGKESRRGPNTSSSEAGGQAHKTIVMMRKRIGILNCEHSRQYNRSRRSRQPQVSSHFRRGRSHGRDGRWHTGHGDPRSTVQALGRGKGGSSRPGTGTRGRGTTPTGSGARG